MRVFNLPLVIFLFVCFVFTVDAQQDSNVKSKFSDVIFSESTKKKQESLDSAWARRSGTKVMSLGGPEVVYTIPVVVHIIHNNGTENITDAQVQIAIQRLNDAFSNSNGFANAQGVDVDIEFCLAKQDVNKVPHSGSGINRFPSALTNVSVPAQDIALKALSYWPSDKYLNIWVVKEITGGGDPSVAGYATLPSSHGTVLDGVVVEARYFAGSTNDSKVTVHELGHYLGLYHTFESGCTNNNCLQDGDQVCDTPPEGTDGILPNCTSFRNSCDTDDDDLDVRNPFRPVALNGRGDQHDIGNNYMNYNTDACQISFTQGQKERMRYYFETVRMSLANTTACQPGCTSLITANFTISSPYNAGQILTFTNTSSNATSYQWLIDGVNYATSANMTKVFPAEGNYTIKLIASNSNSSCTQEISQTITVTCPIISSFTASATDIQPGQSVTFTSTGNAVSSYQWYVNGTLQAGATNNTYVRTFATANTYLVQLKSVNGQCEKYSASTIVKTGECPKNKTTNIWYFGQHAGVNFNSGSPKALINGAIDSGEPAAAVCDNTGNLLFYTDGITVWNKNHVVMPNGANLLGGGSATHTLIVPKPSSSGVYYIFSGPSVDQGGTGLYYSIVNMNTNGSLGDVDINNKNIQLLNTSSEQMLGAFHSNGTDIWVVVKSLDKKYWSYLLTSSGLSQPVMSLSTTFGRAGQIKISNNNTLIVSSHTENAALELLTFNNSSGTLSNPWIIAVQTYGVEISPDNSKLYLTTGAGLMQYDLLAGSNINIQNSVVNISNINCTGLQLGPDNKIYISKRFSRFLSVVNNPNLSGAACNYISNDVLLDVNGQQQNISLTGIPTVFNTNYKNVLSVAGPSNICLSGTAVKYSANTTAVGAVTWSISGGATITSQAGLDVYITFPQSGTYTLQALQNTTCGMITSTYDVVVNNPFSLDLIKDAAICSVGGNYTYTGYPGSLYSLAYNEAYQSIKFSTTPATYNEPFDYNFTTSVPGKYWMEATKGGCTARDEFTVFPYVPVSTLNLGPDKVSCTHSVVVLDAGSGYKTYLWSDGSTGQKLTTYKPGSYSVTVTGYCGGTATDQIVISNTPAPATSVITGLAAVCPNTVNVTYSVTATVGSTYTWTVPSGATYTSNPAGNQITVSFGALSGDITVTETIGSGCKSTMVLPVAVGKLISITTANDEPTVLIPTCHPSVTLNATAGFASYSWKKGNTVIPGASTSTLIVTQVAGQSQGGIYTVTGVTAQGCSASTSVTVIDALTITGDDQICPGEKASLQVDIAGVIGNYYVQWVQNGGTPTYTPSGGGGNYSAMVVLPTFAGCTLTTAPKQVTLKLAPSPYTVSTDKNFICGNSATLTAKAPAYTAVPITDNTWNNGGGTFAGIPSYLPSVLDNVTAGGSYYVISMGDNKCTAISNIVFIVPHEVRVTQRCTSGGAGTELIADQNIPNGNYVWKNSGGTVVATTQSYIPTIVGTYTVTSISTNCQATASTVVCAPPSANLGTNLATRGDFNIKNVASPICTNYAVTSDLTCSDATTTPLNSVTWPSNFKITSSAGPENLNKWSGTGFFDPSKPADTYCMIADGRVTLNDERVWYQQVSVENCATYTFRALIDNIIVNEAEIPRVSLRIKNGPYNSFIKGTTVFASQSNWVELSGTWKSTMTGTVEISVVLDGGGFVGRDIAIDEIYFAKTNCSSLDDFRVGRSCKAVTDVGMSKYICSGQSVQIGNNLTTAGLSYSWTAPGYSSTAMNPIVNPTVTNTYKLVVTDNVNNCSATDYVTVTIISPEVTITKDLTTGCTATQVKASLFNGVPGVQYEWQVNGIVTATNSTGIFSLTGLANGAVVRCRLVTACASNVYSNSITVGNSAPITATQTSICPGTSTQLRVNMSGGTAPFTYTWTASSGAVPAAVAEPIVSPTATTTYGLTYKDANNCTFTGSITITMKSLPPPAALSSYTGCVGTQPLINVTYGSFSNSLISLTEPSFMTRISSTQNSGSVSFIESINAAGTGSFVAVTANSQGCIRTTTLPFTAYDGPTPMTISISPNPACLGTTITATASFGTANTFVSLTEPTLVNRIDKTTSAGVYNMTGAIISAGTGNFVGISTNAQGCSTTVSVPFTALPLPSVNIQSTGTLICSGSPILLSTGAIVGASYQWLLGSTVISGATSESYRTATAGAYTIKVTDVNGCASKNEVTLTASNLAAPRVHVDDATNAYCASTPAAMKVGTALQLNGTTQYVNVPAFNFPASGTTYGGAITVEFWIKATTSASLASAAFSIGGLNNTNRVQAHVPHTDGNLYWDYGNYAGNGRIFTPYTSYVGKWTHVALVSAGNGGNYKAIYLNGVNVASSTAASDGPDVQLNALTIGKWLNFAYFQGGMMDEFRIWNKVLSAAEVQSAMTALYESGTPNLMGSWGFDEASGTTANNDAFSAQTGTLMNGAARVYPTTGLTYSWSPSANLNTGTGTTVIPNTTIIRTYTVKGVDGNGCSAYAQVVASPTSTCKDPVNEQGADVVSTDWDVDVYPNPTERDVHISFINISEESKLSIEVIGMDGVIILQIDKVEVNQVCNLHDLPSGLYLIRVRNGEEIKTKKVVVVK